MNRTLIGLGLALFALAGCGEKVHRIENVTVQWHPLESVQRIFPAAPKPMFLYVHETGCDYCDRMDSLILSRPEVAHYLNTYFTPVAIDLSGSRTIVVRDSSMTEQEFRRFLSIRGVPSYYFFDPQGRVIGAFDSEMDLLLFKQMLVYIRSGHFVRQVPWDEFLKLPESQLDTLRGVF